MTQRNTRLVSCLVFFVSAVLIGINLPTSSEKARLMQKMGHPIDATHLNQSWTVFSPDPATASTEVSARVTFASGATTTFTFPKPGLFLSAYRGYRFRKYGEAVANPAFAHLREPLAEWIVRRYSTEADLVTSVELSATGRVTPQPGTDFTEVRIDTPLFTWPMDAVDG